ncbi:hypothetical protein ACMGDK_18605 [Chryseobacterium sp. DT-3]
MKDLFYYSFKGKRKEQILQYLKRNVVTFIRRKLGQVYNPKLV